MSKRYPGLFRPWYRDKKTGERKQCARWRIKFSYRGKTIREKTGTTSEKEAWDMRLRRLSEISQGRYVGPESRTLGVQRLVSLVEDAHAGRPYVARIKRRLRRLVEFFGPMPAIEITLADLTKYKATRINGGAAPATVKVELAHLHRGFVLAVESKLLPSVPKFPEVPVDNARRVFIERPQLEALLRHLSPYLVPVFRVALLTGWRRKAVLSRQRSMVDLAGRWLYLETSKNKEPIQVPLIPALHEVFATQDALARDVELRTGRVIPWCFFYPEDGAHFKAGDRIKAFDRPWTKARAAAGLSHVYFHDLRRGAIRTLRRSGASEHEIMEWVGLKTRHVFDRYDIIDEKRRQETGERLQRFYEAQASEPQPVVPFSKKA